MKSKMLAVLMIMSLVLPVSIATSAMAQEEGGILDGSPVEVSADTAVYSKYMWRGFKLDDDPVMQNGLYISAYGFTASVWGSFDIDSDDALNSDEVDYAIDYTYSKDIFSVSVGNTYYDFPAGDAASREFYIGVGLDTILAPSLTYYHDYGEEDSGGGDGDYIVLGIGHSFTLGDGPITLDLSGSLGYNNELFIEGEGTDLSVSAGLTIPLTAKCSFSPSISYSVPFGDLEDSNDGNQDEEFFGGAIITFSM